ncbi:MAG: hypothetical protein AAF604_14695 [Acidobacteriota bacterium]
MTSKSLATIFLLGLLAVSTVGCGLADIRNSALQVEAPTAEAVERGRALLEATAERHGLAAWSTFRTQEVTAVDTWPGWKRFMGHWPGEVQRFRTQTILGTFTSRAELLDGEKAGETWGIQSWATYKQQGDGEPEFADDDHILFYLPTLQYFNELPYRLRHAEIVAYAGEDEHNGKTYDLVYATWGSFAANETHDQYELWIGRDSGLLEMAFYTVRDGMKSAVGTIHFTDYREVQGVWFPFVQTVIIGSPKDTEYPLDKNYFHRIEVESTAFDTVAPEALRPDPALRTVGDAKPAAS